MKSTSTALRLVPLGHLATSLHGANHLIALVKKGVPNTETFLRTLGCASLKGTILIFRGIGTSFSGRSVTKPQTPQALVPLKKFRGCRAASCGDSSRANSKGTVGSIATSTTAQSPTSPFHNILP